LLDVDVGLSSLGNCDECIVAVEDIHLEGSFMKEVATLDMSEVEGGISAIFLSWIAVLDEYGAATWNLRLVGVVTALFLGLLRVAFDKKGGVDWMAFVHAILSGYGSLMCVWLNVFSAETLTGTSEPLRSIMCHGALTSLHRIVPAITMGYALFDIFESFSHGIDFILHGVATFTIMAYFNELNVGEIIVPMLLMEVGSNCSLLPMFSVSS
jgi:hypothetical protein